MSGLITSFVNGAAVSPAFTTPANIAFRDIINEPQSAFYGWQVQQIVANDRITPAQALEPQRSAAGTLKITVEPGDNPISSTGERNEYASMFLPTGNDVNGTTPSFYIGISLYLPSYAWAGKTNFGANPWCIALQLHGPDSGIPANQGSPVFELNMGTTEGFFTCVQRGGPTTNVQKVTTNLGAIIYDTWLDFLFQITPAIDNTGYTAVWTRTGKTGLLQQKQLDANNNGAAIAPWNTPTLYSDGTSAYNHYFKRGCYRSVVNFTTMFYASNVCRSTDFASCAWGAFGQYP